MEKIGVAFSAYGSRCAAELWKMYSSELYSPVFYGVARQNNPMIKRLVELTGGHMIVDSSLDMSTHMKIIEDYNGKIDLVICPHEKLVIAGWRDEIEKINKDVKFTFPRSAFAFERSKILQRQFFPKDFNPQWKAFYPSEFSNRSDLETAIRKYIEELGGLEKAVFKPDIPAAGRGVLVFREHVKSLHQFFDYISDFNQPFLIEEWVDAEESSSQIWYDGHGSMDRLKDLRYPEVRDYKRAFDEDKGPNTGGMGCYEDNKKLLPWMTLDDFVSGFYVTKVFIEKTKKWAIENGYDTDGMWPCMHYNAMAHPHKVFEANTGRPGDPEDITALMTMENDLIDFYLRLAEGHAPRLKFEKKAAVLVYVVPPKYGDKNPNFEDDITIHFEELCDVRRKNPMYFPGDVEIKDDNMIHARSSRSVAVVATANTMEEAALIAREGAELVELSSFPKGLWHRKDIGSEAHTENSKRHRLELSSF